MRYGTGVMLVLAAGSLWSLMGLGLRQIEGASVWAIMFWRSVGMVPVLLAWIAWTSDGRPVAAVRSVGVAGAIGGFGLVFAFAGAIYAIQTTTIANAVFLFTASPFVAAVLGWILLRERVTPATWAAIALAVVGMFVMVREGLAVGALVGNMAALLSAVGFGAFSVALRWGKLANMLPAALLGAVFSAVAAAVVIVMLGEPFVVSARDMGIATGIGAVVLAVGMILFTTGSRVIPAADLTLFSLIEVLLAPLWVWAILGETASSGTFVGGAILLAAVAFNAIAGTRARRVAAA
ncbi:MAG: DMT family transporter [Tabrizicola sp.]|uniref:DMT family transporter n=1 Tax=Tabrizicola sp. TaxID=2005166 RepID=UPI0027369797|nr:DMT family transporter [Tabrizicola sp.]MDP3264912.1 DMT family transporter [Tabrizicola sp.]MDP3647648.1 DMT family transporter [Paracoccaceae bacterium]MDZ4067655.1 DMT family transporter [Tabrizicola sp.]